MSMDERLFDGSGKHVLPSIYIVGTMKGGTTALYDHICTHPRVVGGSEKEIHYYSMYLHRGLGWYAEQFAGVPEGALTIDASPTYFDMATSAVIPNLINTTSPDSKIFIIVRDPVARAVSHFFHLQKVMKIDAVSAMTPDEFFSHDFDRAVTQETQMDWLLNHVLWFSSYYRRYLYYKGVFPEQRLRVLTNDELRNEPHATMRKVYDFLELDWHDDRRLGEVKHSTGSDVSYLSDKVFHKLGDLLYPGYEKFCRAAKLRYERIERPRPSNKAAPAGQAVAPADVHVGRDGWLFLAGGSNSVLDFYTKPKAFSPEAAEAWWRILHNRHEALKQRDIQYLHVVAPEKLSVYDDKYDGQLDHYAGRPGAALLTHPAAGQTGRSFVIDPTNYLKKVASLTPTYWKTDTHWTFQGAYAVYQLICSRLDLKVDPSISDRPCTSGLLAMDLGSKLDPVRKEEVRFYSVQKRAKRTFANCLVTFQEKQRIFNEIGLHVGTHVVFRNDDPAAIDKKVMLFGDSFSEYRPHLLTAILAEAFREVHFVWSANLDFDYIDKEKPDIVVSQLAERFLPRVPTDVFNVTTFAQERLADFQSRKTSTMA